MHPEETQMTLEDRGENTVLEHKKKPAVKNKQKSVPVTLKSVGHLKNRPVISQSLTFNPERWPDLHKVSGFRGREVG